MEPVATYRLQLRNGMTFDRAAALADYLAGLGVSHLYASPLFAASKESTHGYDGIDLAVIEPEIGGEVAFDRLCAALKHCGLDLIVDFVPNHMAADSANGWWRSVLEWGPASPYAAVFDIDWSASKLLLPILGTPYAEALQEGAFGVVFEAATGDFALTCYDRKLPLTPASYGAILTNVEESAVLSLAPLFAHADIEESVALKRRLAEITVDPACLSAIHGALARLRADPDRLHEIHEAQIWRLAYWRLGREALTYRRFFEIAGLVCLRVEDPLTFEAVHAKLFELIATGRVSGVRLDHIDGLADPTAYLIGFQDAVADKIPFYLLVEKILEGDEELRPDWPVAGTTGYEFIAALADVFVDQRGKTALNEAYQAFSGDITNYASALIAAKTDIFEHNLAAELAVLAAHAHAIAAHDVRTRDFGTDTIRRAIVALVAALPAYRSYVDETGPDEADRKVITKALADATASRVVDDTAAIDFIARLLLLDFADPAARRKALAFTRRFQQTSGPVMAKAAEDTMYYRYNRLIALNEVGGIPDRFGAPLSEFHMAMTDRREKQPAGLSATATHDTKRGEDSRARLYVLSEMPRAWRQAVERWAAQNAPHRAMTENVPAPEPTMEWLYYQALLGAWPLGLSIEDEAGLEVLRVRMCNFMEKAIREAKLETSWTNPDATYEKAIFDFVNRTLSPQTGKEFLVDFVTTCRPNWIAGAVNGLSQLAIKLVAPGVPDIYQGTELWDFSLVDPDNRTAVDFTGRQRMLGVTSLAEPKALLDDWASGAPKLALTAAGLRLRSECPALFAKGNYIPLRVTGAKARNVVAFARTFNGESVVMIAPRFVLELTCGAKRPLVSPDEWQDTSVHLPDTLAANRLRDIITSSLYRGHDQLQLDGVLSSFPVALLAQQ